MPTPTPTPKPTTASSTPNLSTRLLRRAHSPLTAYAIHSEKIKHKPLILYGSHPAKHPVHSTPITTPGRPKDGSKLKDARELRREARNAKLEAKGKRRRKKPQPLSAKEKRRLCIYEIPKAERKYEIYAGLHELWCQYVRGVLGAEKLTGSTMPTKLVHLTPQAVGPLLVSADFHGAKLEVVRSRSVSRVGLTGIVVRDTKFTFEIITMSDEIKVIPKEHSVFRFQVPLTNDKRLDAADDQKSLESLENGDRSLVFELYGDQFKSRAPDRASKKFKVHIPPDI